ncbi:protein CUSTOS isoform X2 [Gracilinanus agilis]|uniref:protein CUSTOS isoform X2 n=1 Tax=Gracilinanus agilis TaxID=191870 RepID=UPI001CFDC094|nr:protein CUSTOS isoform X2 [Gracilinanus agilis]
MAAPRGNVSDSESSSEDSTEELQRCREAAVPAWGWGPNLERGQEVTAKDNLPAARPSLRLKVDDHEQDGNELQTTPEFRVHVAKKLGAFLDSCITISESRPKLTQTPAQTEPPGEDDGFRLFFTSIPGSPKDSGPPTMRRKRPPSRSSGSDSDEEWRRCQEAAVSGTDILRHGALPAQDTPEEKQTPKKKKKKKKKKQVGQGKEAGPRVSVEKEPERGKAQPNGDHVPLTTKKKKRKKKNRKEDSETLPFPPQKNQAACGTE